MEATYVDGFVCKFDPPFRPRTSLDLFFGPHHLGDFSPPPRRFSPTTSAMFAQHLGDFSPTPPPHLGGGRKSPRCCREIAEVLQRNRRGVAEKSRRCCRKIAEVLQKNRRGVGRKSPRCGAKIAEVLQKNDGGVGRKSPRWWGKNDEGGSGKKTYFSELVPPWRRFFRPAHFVISAPPPR